MSMLTPPTTTRRRFLQGAGYSATALALRGQTIVGANEQVRVGLIGCGGRGQSLASQFSGLKDARIVALSDADTVHMDRIADSLGKKGGTKPDLHQDFRKLLERKDIDAVVIATPNHWHSLQTIHACQAGKDVYVEKPVSHDIWEGKQAAAAAQRYERIVQAGTQNRSDTGLIKAFDYIHQGKIGAIKAVRGLCYRNRSSIGKVDSPLQPPSTVDYNLWLGPARDLPMFRKQFHYDWHWIYNTGNGDIGNQGPHEIDLISWVLGDPALPGRVQSFGGRFGWNDGGETANMQAAWWSINGVPVIFEVNNMWQKPDQNTAVSYKSMRVGIIVTCEDGEFRGGRGGGYVVGPDGKTKIEKFPGDAGKDHAKNFIDAVRSRRKQDLRAPIEKSYRSAAVAHLANISLLNGDPHSADKLREAIPNHADLRDIIDRQEEQLRDWSVDTTKTPYKLGPIVTVDPDAETVSGPDNAVKLSKPEYRKDFAVPEIG